MNEMNPSNRSFILPQETLFEEQAHYRVMYLKRIPQILRVFFRLRGSINFQDFCSITNKLEVNSDKNGKETKVNVARCFHMLRQCLLPKTLTWRERLKSARYFTRKQLVLM